MCMIYEYEAGNEDQAYADLRSREEIEKKERKELDATIRVERSEARSQALYEAARIAEEEFCTCDLTVTIIVDESYTPPEHKSFCPHSIAARIKELI